MDGQHPSTLRPSRRLARSLPLVAALALFPLLPQGPSMAQAQSSLPLSPNATVFARGLNNPRGLAFGPDGRLYVAEGGTGGTRSTVGRCTQAPMPAGPYTGGFTARISKIGPHGQRSTVVDGLPSDQMSAAAGGAVSGVAAVAFLHGTLYALLSGAGCSHGLAGTVNGVIRVGPHGAWTRLADLSTFSDTHPVASVDPDDFETDGTWYGLVAAGGNLYVTGANHQELDQITPAGAITRLVDFSTRYPGATNWQGPTALAASQGRLYVSFLTPFPTVVGAASLDEVSLDGQVRPIAAGLTAVVGLARRQGQLYALEMTSVPGMPGPTWAGQGQVVRITAAGTLQVVARGLTFPTGMTFGPDGALYVANQGFGMPAGAGQIVRITLPAR